METSYVPDLTQGDFQPLEEADEEWLEKIDLEAIIKQAEILTAMLAAPNTNMSQSSDTNNLENEKKFPNHIPSLLKLHTVKPVEPVAKTKEKKTKIVPPRTFLPPVSDSQVDDARFKR